jgi:hypothetical protein
VWAAAVAALLVLDRVALRSDRVDAWFTEPILPVVLLVGTLALALAV